MKKLLIKLFVLLFITCIPFSMHVSASENEQVFKGSRTVELYIDSSDLDNFVNGGRSGIEFAVRQNSPEGISCTVSSKDRDVYVNISFDFVSLADYEDKLQKLITYSPTIVYDGGNSLLESYTVYDLLNFVDEILATDTFIAEKTTEDLFKISKNEIVLNSKTYEIEDIRINLLSDSDKIKFEQLSINVTCKNDGSFVTLIDARINPELYNEKSLLKAFQKVGEVEYNEEEPGVFVLEFNSASRYEYKKNLMICLGVAFSSSEISTPIDEKTVSVKCIDKIDTTYLFENDANFSYTFDCPSYYNNISVEEGFGQLTENSSLTANDNGELVYYFERGLSFETVEINTDLSNMFGKIKRTIKLKMPISLATKHHEYIKKEISDKLIRGSTFNIYNEGAIRCYEISFSSFLSYQIENFTDSILDGSCEFEINENWIPYLKSSVEDSVSIGEIIPDSTPPHKVLSTYTLPHLSFFSGETENGIISGKQLTMVSGNNTTSFYYRTLDPVKSVLLFLIIVIFTILFIILKHRLRKRKTLTGSSDYAKFNKEESFSSPHHERLS